ncbi:helix-turn-helix domain-containing protein [Moraxella nasovis]
MPKNGYIKLERGENRITIEHLFKIAQEFNIDVSELLKEHKDIIFFIGR